MKGLEYLASARETRVLQNSCHRRHTVRTRRSLTLHRRQAVRQVTLRTQQGRAIHLAQRRNVAGNVNLTTPAKTGENLRRPLRGQVRQHQRRRLARLLTKQRDQISHLHLSNRRERLSVADGPDAAILATPGSGPGTRPGFAIPPHARASNHPCRQNPQFQTDQHPNHTRPPTHGIGWHDGGRGERGLGGRGHPVVPIDRHILRGGLDQRPHQLANSHGLRGDN